MLNTTKEVLFYLYEDKFVSSNESTDSESDFTEYVGTTNASDSNSDEESAATHEPVRMEQ